MRRDSDETIFEVAGRGELPPHILIENMRREGYEAGRLAPGACCSRDVTVSSRT